MSSRKKFLSEASVILLLVFITSLVIATPLIDFTSQTYTNDTHTANRSIPINVSIVEEDLASLYYNWNGTNYTIFNNSLVFMMNFDNLSSLGENNSNAVDASKYGNNGTVYGAAWNSSGKYEGAYSFDGDDDYIAVVDSMFDFTGDFTVSFWIKPASNNENNGLISKDSLPGTAHPYTSEFAFDLRDTNNIWFVIGTTTPWGWHFANSTSTLNAGNWYHITGTVNGFNMILYVNGIEEANVSREGYGRRSDSNNPIKIGVNPDYVNFVDPKYFNGSIDEVRIWNRSLSVNEVFQQYVSNFNKFNSTQLYFYVNQTKNATTGLDDGTYTYQIFAENSSGIINTTELRTITIDTTPPIVTINTPSNGSTINNQTPELNATFGGETVAYAWYSVNNTENSTPISNTNNLTVTFLPLPSGAHNITLYANDSLGNLNSSIVNFAIDTSAPVVTASKTYSDYAQINPMTIDSNITVTDADTNVTGARVSIGDGYVSSEDYLNYTTINGITGNYSTVTGILTLTGNRSGSDYQAAFRNVTYWNSNTNNPNTSQRNVTFAIGNNSLYFPGTGHYYEFVSPTLTWTDAKTAADAKTFYSLQGYLATINSSEENTFIQEKVSGNAWIGASDSAVEGDWKWVTGPEAGTLFYRGTGASHTAFGYDNWASGEPNDASNEDVAEMYSTGGGTWNDLSGTSPLNYLVEYGGMAGDPTLHLTAMVIVNVTDIMPPTAPTITVPEDGASLTSAYTRVNGTMSADTTNVTVYVNGTITNDSVSVSGTTYSISNVPLGSDGVHEINVSAKDAAGNVNSTNATVIVTVDTTAPFITIISPVNTTYSTASITLNVTANQTANVTYSLNGAANLSLYNLTIGGNTTITGIEGANNITVYANDPVGNLNYSAVNFTIDTIAPSITIISPVNTTYSTASITLNVTTNQTANVTYSLNGAENQSLYNLSASLNTTITGIEGANNITVYANDPVGNLNYSTVNFTIDTIAPSITIISPLNTTYSTVSITLNVTTNQTANVTYSLNGAANLSLYNLTTGGNTTITGIEGANNITVYANDSAGNIDSATVNFTIYIPIDIYVNTTGWWRPGGAFYASATRIQAAINNATAGDTIYVYNGSYTENVDVNKAVTLQGEGAGVVTVTAALVNDHVFELAANYVNISGFKATGATGSQKAGIYLGSVNYTNISNNNASNNYHGIWLLSSNNNNLTNNTAKSNTQYGIYLITSSNNNTLTNNTVNLNKYQGIRLVSSSNNNITNNTANSNADNGIWLYSSSNNTLTNNTVNLNLHGFDVQASSNYNTLSGNNVSSNSAYGFWVEESSNYNTLSGNNVSFNTQYGIYLSSSSNNTIYNNYFNNTHNAYDNRNNTWNTTRTEGKNIINGSYFGGNYWSDYAGEDTNGDRLGDTLTPYNSSDYIAYGGDYHPLMTVDTIAPSLSITSYAPSSSVSDLTGAARTFNISTDQVVNVTWYLNGTQLFTNTSVTEANYTNSSAGLGTWNVTAIVNNTNGTDSQEWTWIVMADIMPPVVTISVPVNNANISIFDRIISGSITDESAITANMYVNSLFTNTWSSKGSFRWPYNFTNGSNTINISVTDAYYNINWTNISVFVLSPINEASLNLTANQSLNMTANDSAGVDVVLSTGNNTANVTVKINASINASHFNVSDIDTEFVALGIARKSLVKFVEINATGDVVNLSGVKFTMFYNDSDLDLNGNGIIDAGDIKEDTLNLYWHWGNDTSGSQEWFPLTLGADYSGKFDRNNKSGPIVINVEKNTAFRYISVSTDHFSVYSIAGASIPATPTTTTPSGSSGSGSGGSGVVTEEPYENIAVYEMIEKNIEAGKPATYTFTKNQDVIYEVLVTGKENEYDISMRIEILKNRSKQAKENAPGLVYRNANIISGTNNIGENVIKFKVNDSWLRENGFDSSDIRLVKWVDNKWITLETGVLFNRDGYTHFSAKSMTFSTYAITGIKKEEMMPAQATEKPAVTQDATPFKPEEPTLQPEGKTSLWILMIIAGLLIAALVYVLKRR